MILNKKALGPVVATALLIVVAVGGVVGFQTWFNSFSSQLQTQTEVDSSGSLDTRVERVVGDNLYFRNGNSENLSIDKVMVGNKDCNISQNITSGMQSIDLGNCTSNISESSSEVVVYTNEGIYTQEIFLSSQTQSSGKQSGGSSFSLDCDSLPGEWSAVPGNSNLNTNDFCVMKYEAKDVSGTATSQASLTPWVNIDQLTARAECSALGPGYQLITDAQRVTMARNIENIPENWADGVIGSNVSNGGGLKKGNVGQSNSVSYNGNDPADRSLDTNTKSMLNLSTGDVVWDISGNVWEWSNDTIDQPNSGLGVESGSTGWHEWTEINNSQYGHLEPYNSTFNNINGVGAAYADDNGALPSGTTYGFERGGDWGSGLFGGVFTLFLYYAPSASDTDTGFRCTYVQ